MRLEVGGKGEVFPMIAPSHFLERQKSKRCLDLAGISLDSNNKPTPGKQVNNSSYKIRPTSPTLRGLGVGPRRVWGNKPALLRGSESRGTPAFAGSPPWALAWRVAACNKC